MNRIIIHTELLKTMRELAKPRKLENELQQGSKFYVEY